MTNKMPVVGKRYKNKIQPTFIVVESIKDGWITTKGFCKIQLSDFWHWFEKLPEDNLQETEEVPVVASKDFMEGYNAGWNDFGFKKDYRFKESTDNEPKGNKTPNPVDFEKGEVSEVERALKQKGTTDQENKYFQAGWVGAREMFRKANSETKEAMNLLQFQVDNYGKEYINEVDPAFLPPLFIKTLERAKNLLDALEAEKKINFPKEPNWVWVDLAKKQSWSNMSKPEPKIDMKEECVEAKDIDVPTKSIWKDVSELPEDDDLVPYLIKSKNGAISIGEFRYFDDVEKGVFFDHISQHDNNVEAEEIGQVIAYTTLTNFINSFEQIQKDIEELKRNKGEGK